MYQDTYRPGNFATFARRLVQLLGKVLISSFGRRALSKSDALSEHLIRLLAQAEREIDSIRHDLDRHSLQQSSNRSTKGDG
jgi:hypothetical protein